MIWTIATVCVCVRACVYALSSSSTNVATSIQLYYFCISINDDGLSFVAAFVVIERGG